MRYRTLGRTGLEVSELGLGGLFISEYGHDSGIDVVHRALDLGVNFFDTAPSYPNSQAVMGKALEGVDKQHFVSTKIGPSPLFAEPRYDYDSIMAQFEHNLKELRRDYVDILHIHDPDRYGDKGCPGNYRAVFGRGMALETLKKLKADGRIGAIGLASLWTDFQAYCVGRGEFDVVLTFNRYGLIWRDAQFQSFPFCRRHSTGVIQGTPFHQGVLTEAHAEWIVSPPEWMSVTEHRSYRRLLEIQAQTGMTLRELALRFILSNPTISLTIAGAADTQQLEANAADVEKGPLPDSIHAEIESLGILHEDPRRYI